MWYSVPCCMIVMPLPDLADMEEEVEFRMSFTCSATRRTLHFA
jgi:hypothetical protein